MRPMKKIVADKGKIIKLSFLAVGRCPLPLDMFCRVTLKAATPWSKSDSSRKEKITTHEYIASIAAESE